jgi:hypothetical protein
MKNIHLLPTHKPSKLYRTGVFILLDSKAMPHDTLETINQHIYITSDEEIKEGDWFIYGNNILKANFTHKPLNKVKIILTTDADLIADGVQAIDDTFLEWFVKNPTCDYVEIQKWFDGIDFLEYKIIIPQEEPKQETLEKVAKSKAFEFKVDYKPFETDLDYREYAEYGFKKGFLEGAEWQQERTFSFNSNFIPSIIEKYLETAFISKEQGYMNPKEWLEQFKKK